MKIAVVAPSPVPFVFGGAERFWLDLVRALNELTPHEVELLKVPFPEGDFWAVLDGYRRFFHLDLGAFDGVISTKYPAWMVQHPYHIVYLQHKLRGLYDTYPRHLPTAWPRHPALASIGRLIATADPSPAQASALFEALEPWRSREEYQSWFAFPGPVARAVVHFLDRVALRPGAIRRYAAISQTVATRDGYFPPGVEVAVAHHPSGLCPPQEPLPPEPVLFTVSRLDAPKRIDLIIRAFLQVQGAVKLEIAGTGPQEEALRALAGSDRRIRFLGRLSDAELAQAYARARAVVFVPEQEDLGLVTLEAMAAGRPVITTTDAGGPTELVQDGETGLVVAAEETALAEAMQTLASDAELARRLGAAGRHRAGQVNWNRVITTLGLGGNASPAASPTSSQQTILVLAPFDLRPPRSGGPNRIFHLYRAWSRKKPVRILCLGSGGQWHFAPQLTIEEIPVTAEFRHHADRWTQRLGVSAADLALLDGIQHLPEYVARVREAVGEAGLVVLSHPYCLRALPRLTRIPPLVYDAHNVEVDLKAMMWDAAATPETDKNAALALLREAEAETLAHAAAVLVVSEEEAERFHDLYTTKRQDCILTPNGVALERRPFVAPEDRAALRRRLGLKTPLAVFVGAWHEPNVVALETLMRAAERLPKVTFAIAGSLCAHPRLRQCPANVACLGQLSDSELAVLLGAAHVGLNPVTLGAGTNLKVLDYAACGATIVSTAFGVRGLPLAHGEQAWLCGTDRFANGIAALLDDDALRHRLAYAARQVAERFSWQTIGETSLSALEAHGNLR